VTAPRPLLQTKLFPPRTTRGLVDRDRLRQRLDPPELPAVLVVSAPAGFGKSTLLAQALLERPSRDGPAVAWLSLDAGDSDPSTYWAYVLAALRTAAPAVGESAQVLLDSPGGAPVTSVVTSLLNDLAGSEKDVVLVLDDYHVVHAPEIHEAMTFLVEHLPPQLRLVIATRSDPPLPLARLRARGQLLEIRAADLRFTERESAAYFDGMGSTCRPARWPPWKRGRRVGWQPCSSRRCPCGVGTTLLASSLDSPGTTDTSSTTWWRRWCTGNPKPCGTSCSGRPCCPGCQDR
jgi:LuxR family maltose regulon positive regulatory protein